MPGNRKLQGNGPATDRIEEAMEGLKVEESDRHEQGSYPDRPGEPDCIYYLRTGSCGYGTNCRFNHPSDNIGRQVDATKNTSELPERDGQPDCGFYLKTGTCKYGSVCKFHHPKNKQPDKAVMNTIGLPMRQDVKPCPYYMRTRSCKYGSACKFHHPQPALDLATYYASSLPLHLPPSRGWSAYTGTVNPAGSVLTSPAANGQLSVSYLPDRPDQPECRHFLNFGSCKYGSECKYHHPMEKISHLASGSIGPLGLPVRPGQPVCSQYILYGLCTPTCIFDHPLNGCSYAYIPYGQTVPPPTFAFPSSTSAFQPYASYPIMAPPPPVVTVSDPKRLAGDDKKVSGGSSDQTDSVPQSSKSSSKVVQNGES